MLNTPAPFPQVGSEAIVDDEGEVHLVRILGRDLRGNVTLAFPARFGASGTKTVPLASLGDPTPLTAEEHKEMSALARPGRHRKADRERLKALRLRIVFARTAERKRRELPWRAA